MLPVTVKASALRIAAKVEGGKLKIDTEAGYMEPGLAGVQIDDTSGVDVLTLSAGERQLIAQAEGGVIATVPATTHGIPVAAGATVVLTAPGGAGGEDDYILEVLFDVTDPAGAEVTVTDGEGVEADGALKNFRLMAAGTPAGPYEKKYASLRSRTGPWTIKAGTGVRLHVGAITK